MIDELQWLGKQYHYRCEVFDRRICSAKSERSGDALPADNDEHRAISLNANNEKARIREMALQMGYKISDADEAIKNTAQFSFEQLKEMFKNQPYLKITVK